MGYTIKERNGKRFVVKEPDRIKKGFTFWLGEYDVFVITENKNRTKELASEVLRKLKYPVNDYNVSEITFRLIPATLEPKMISQRKQYLLTKTKGSTIVDPEGKTLIIKL